MRLTEKELDDLTSYADGEARLRGKRRISAEQLAEAALNDNVEKCAGCGWWTESCNLLPIDGDEPDGKCDNCR